MRYTSFISDGDSSAFNAVYALNNGRGPYNVPVVKEKCIYHVSKHLGTHLCKLKASLSETVMTKVGKLRKKSGLAGKKGLTDVDIDKLQKHHATNTRCHDFVESMCAAIQAIYGHARSTQANQQHQASPPGETFWCCVKREEALRLKPAPHSTKKLYLPGVTNGEHHKQKFQIFVDLSSDSLCLHCLKKHNQNPNKRLHSKLRKICIKHKDCSTERVAFDAGTVMLKHNFGCVEGSLMARLGLVSGDVLEHLKDEDNQKAVATPTRKHK